MCATPNMSYVCNNKYVWVEYVYTTEYVWVQLTMSHVTRMNESLHSQGFNEGAHKVMSHLWMCHVTHMNESCHTHKSVTSHVSMSHVTVRTQVKARIESCASVTFGASVTHSWLYACFDFRVKRMNVSRHTCELRRISMRRLYSVYMWVCV